MSKIPQSFFDRFKEAPLEWKKPKRQEERDDEFEDGDWQSLRPDSPTTPGTKVNRDVPADRETNPSS